MKYLVILIIFILQSCSETKNVKLQDLNKILKKDQIKSNGESIKNVKSVKSSKKKTKVKEKKINIKNLAKKKKKYKTKEISKKKKMVKNKNSNMLINIYKVENINEYEDFLRFYSKNSEYPNINN